DLLPDGLHYFHSCPPVRELLDDTGTPIDAATAAGIQKIGGVVYERFVERLNKRDENVIASRDEKVRGTAKAEGAGAIDAPAQPAGLNGAVLAAPIAVP